MTSFTFTLTQQDLGRLANPLAKTLQVGDVVALWGDLGVGKTTFTRALVQALVGETIDVPSPTFTLVQVYDCPQGELWHCDLYRLKNSEEAFEIGLEDAFYHAICLIEWPERLEGLLPRCRIDITFKIINETTREITVNLVGSSHDALRTALESSR
ncbi:MAG: tRNA ((37)-N6)-threonylcarbamoyltransferase complex ATPase subunit type 1 TsaE [Alphaproteobacteria bacterium]|jgi:tRNA threonylcarbamoyladenosine biosynthesis protein TsaE|nr:tRNA ((37)-N6)-threonylcarbamoyltransferase complex ATPase subunit type 1 TsaE [Alphaproteobacteria bacterium]